MFSLSTGTFHEIEAAVLADLADAKKNDPMSSLLVLSPSGHLLTHLQRRLTDQGSFLNIHFLTFYALAERLLAESQYTETVVTEPTVYQEIIRQILSGEKPEAVDLAIRKAVNSSGKPIPRGLAGALAATMKDLRDAGMRADKAIQVTQEGYLGKEAPEAAATLAIYARFIGLFEKKNLRSSADLLRRAAKEAPTHPWLKKQKALFLYGFYDLTGVQLDFVLSLAGHPDARVYFPYEEGNPVHTYAEKLLMDPAFAQKTSPRHSVRPGLNLKPSASLDQVQSAKVAVFSCSGSRDEIWTVAKEITQLTDEGIPYHEIAFVSRAISPYLPALREIFSAHQIPYMCSRNEPAGSHPLVKTVRALLTFDEKHPRAKTLREDLEKSPYLRKPSSPAATGSPQQGTAPTNSYLEERGRGSMDSPPTTAGNDVDWHTHISWATSLIRSAIRLPKDATSEESTLLSAIFESLEDFRILDRLGVAVSRQHFLETWQEKIDLLERPITLKPHQGVQVLEVQEARGLSFKHVFLVGMNEKVFPRLIREDPFLSDKARAALAQATGCRLSRKLGGYDEERLLFALMRGAATERLHLLFQRSDEEGKARIPSVYLKDVERENPGLKTVRIPRSASDKFEKRSPQTWTPKELSFLTNRAHGDPRPLYQSLRWDNTGFEKLLATHEAIESFRTGLGPHDGVLTDPALVKAALAKPFSPSSLEELAQCPFQYFASHVLDIPVEEELAPEGEMTPQGLGQLFHKTLELFYTACRDSPTSAALFSSSAAASSAPAPRGAGHAPRSPVASGWGGGSMDSRLSHSGMTALLGKAIEGCFEFYRDRLSTVYPLALKATKVLMNKELLNFLKSDIEECTGSGFKPSRFEEPLTGTLPVAGLNQTFYGRPDRVDIEEGANPATRVVDYKSGKPKSWTGRIETSIIQGRFLQLPIYLALAKAASATLRPVRETDEEATEKTLTADFWKSTAAPIFIENLKELIGVIEKERFYIEPDTGDWGYCARCDFSKICRKEHMPTRIRAERDPLRQRVSEKLSRVAPKS